MRFILVVILILLSEVFAMNLLGALQKRACNGNNKPCSENNACCSRKCSKGKCEGGYSCTNVGSCSVRDECCSLNCYLGQCQMGVNGCTSKGYKCAFPSDCCTRSCRFGTCTAGLG